MTPPQEFIAELEQAASRSPSQRGETLRHVTDLFIAGSTVFSEEQVELFDVVLTRLIEVIEASALAELSRRLAIVPNAPRGVVHKLAFADEIDIAGPVLTHSERLEEADLVRNAQLKSQEHLLAISRRRQLPQVLTDILLGRGNPIVVRSTAGNQGARFSDFGYETLIRHASEDDQLALVVAARPELPRHLFLRLVAKASDTVRTRLQALNPQAAGEIKTVVAEVAARIAKKVDAGDHDYAAARAAVDALTAQGRLNEREVRALAEAGNCEEVTVALAVSCGLPIEAVEQAMSQERAETVLIITKALGFSWTTVKAILKARAHGRAGSAYELDHCLANFERLKRATAEQILKFHRARTAAAQRP